MNDKCSAKKAAIPNFVIEGKILCILLMETLLCVSL